MAEGVHARGRASSWVAVSLIILGFLVGGLALPFGPLWWLFWVGVGLVVVGGIIALAIDIFEDVTVDPAHGPDHVTRREIQREHRAHQHDADAERARSRPETP